jgi:hypothetical protein
MAVVSIRWHSEAFQEQSFARTSECASLERGTRYALERVLPFRLISHACPVCVHALSERFARLRCTLNLSNQDVYMFKTTNEPHLGMRAAQEKCSIPIAAFLEAALVHQGITSFRLLYRSPSSSKQVTCVPDPTKFKICRAQMPYAMRQAI